MAHELLKRFDMSRFADFPAGGLSYGHQRRVEMMRALAASPTVLLLDEPVAGMNDVEAEELGAIFLEVARVGDRGPADRAQHPVRHQAVRAGPRARLWRASSRAARHGRSCPILR